MTSRATVLSPATPSEFLLHTLSSQRYPTTIVIGRSQQEFLRAVVEEVALQLSTERTSKQDNLQDGSNEKTISRPFLESPLSQVALSRHIRLVFISTITHLRAYLSILSAANSPVAAPPGYTPDGNPPLLLVYGLLALHRDTSEWSAQGLGNSTAVLVDCAARNAFLPVVVEPRGAGGHDGLDHLARETVPILNGTPRNEDGIWNGRSVTVQQVMSRWFEFESRDWKEETDHLSKNKTIVSPEDRHQD
ncbi:hypothetical protein AK830_g1155 [Neonectria ditissima]|uniref:Uncharacterized protein n=1 Tax=Neonectria ditissima TaxID=78410 RepID=A0A0P7C0G5_9HYPO|nr:hypothetical protein AK830_g1155 [Neonectria ditissima]